MSSTSPTYARLPLDDWHGHDGATAHATPRSAEAGDDLVVASHAFQRGTDTYAVVVASSTAPTEQTVRTVAIVLIAAFPLLLAAVAFGTWVLVGRSLRTVGDITTTVRTIRRGQLDERVVVPPTNDEIALLATTMNEMLTRLEDSDAAQRSFVSDASHDLRTPIASILAAVEVAGREATLQAWEDMAPVIQHAASRMQHLVDGLLLLARTDDGRLALRSEPVDLDDLLSSAAASLRARSDLAVHTDLQPVQIDCDPPRTAQVIANILDNAERFAEHEIWLRCARDGDFAHIEICNDGPPIAPADRERVFDRFVRLDSSRESSRGSSGLGLAIARELSEVQGGTVTTDADPGGRCRFVVRLPLSPASARMTTMAVMKEEAE